MSQPRHPSLGLEALGGGLMVAALSVVLARWLHFDFPYHPNSLGIVSVTTRLHYPTQQEPILFLGFGAAGVLAVWLASGLLGGRDFRPAAWVGMELVALGALAAALLLPTAAATGLVGAAGVGLAALFRAGRQPAAATKSGRNPAPGEPGAQPAPARRRGGWPLALGIVGLAIVRVPRLLQALQVVAAGVPDAKLTRNDWVFLSEDGQHLAWADSLLHGGFQGKDFFCLYGPLYDWSVVWIWKLVGRSIAGWHLHVGSTEVLAWIAFLSLAALLLRRRWLLLPLVLFVPHLSLRIGLGFASLAFLLRHGRSGRSLDALAAGLACGVALLYSQEFGAAALLCAGVLFVVRPSRAGLGAYLGGAALALAPALLVYAHAGALGPMWADLLGYPGLLMAGFGNLPFPSLLASLPWTPAPDPPDERLLRLFYFLPTIAVVALGTSLPRRVPHPRSPFLWLRHLLADWRERPERLETALVALFGLAAFRSALGRSDQIHLYAVAAPSILLLALGADRLLDARRRASGRVTLQLALGLALAWCGGVVTGTGGAGAFHLRNTARTARVVFGPSAHPHGSWAVDRVVVWLGANSEPDDRFYFLPNDAAFYYLTERPPPTRFVVSHQMVTDAHRAEALADLRAAPPRYVVWNDASLRLDGIGDEVVLGPELWAWLHSHYRPAERIGGLRIWEYAPPARPDAQSR